MWMKDCSLPVECSTLSSTHVWKQHERTHTPEKSFTCSAWDKTFKRSNGLFCHKRTHRGKRPFSCSKCDKSFTMSNILKQHEKSFTCSACKKTFTPSNGLLWVIETIRLLKIWQVIQNQMFWSKMREQVLGHLPAQHATRHLHLQMVCYVIRELIVTKRPLSCSKCDKLFSM